MSDIDIRGGCEGAPLELTGEWTGYNNGATMQVGLWIRNDGAYIEQARHHALSYGPERLARRLLHILSNDWHNRPGSAAALTYGCFQDGSHDKSRVDWAQIAYDLIGSDPEQEDLDDAARSAGLSALLPGDSVWALAARTRGARIARWVLEGVR